MEKVGAWLTLVAMIGAGNMCLLVNERQLFKVVRVTIIYSVPGSRKRGHAQMSWGGGEMGMI
jgi:hypothetical protein